VKLVFMGTPSFAAASLRALLEHGHRVAAVFTQPDRPAGRGQVARSSAVKELAQERGLVVEQPEKLRDPAVVERLRALDPEAIVVAAYGKILPKPLLEVPVRGAINVHASPSRTHKRTGPAATPPARRDGRRGSSEPRRHPAHHARPFEVADHRAGLEEPQRSMSGTTVRRTPLW